MNHLYKFDKDYQCDLIGVDEAGRGPLAGPVVAAAVKIKKYVEEFDLINDSKKLSEKKRDLLFDVILEHCEIGVGLATVEEIDEINILNATFLAMNRAIKELEEDEVEFEIVLVDGNHKIRKYDGNQEPIIKGDGKSLAIAAASIIAKVTRDEIMKITHEEDPRYNLKKHKGYGTKEHREAINNYGVKKFHRKTFLKKIIK